MTPFSDSPRAAEQAPRNRGARLITIGSLAGQNVRMTELPSEYHRRLPYGERMSAEPLLGGPFFPFEGDIQVVPLADPVLTGAATTTARSAASRARSARIRMGS